MIQKLLEILNSNSNLLIKKELVYEEVKKRTIDLLKDFNGTYVIQKIITTTPDLKEHIYDILLHNIVVLATNKNGCCALERCIELAYQAQKEKLIEEIISNSTILMTNQFGNYVIQYILSLKDQRLINKVIFSFKDHIEYLSKQKFASNVIEKV